jgi:hypothetical protein
MAGNPDAIVTTPATIKTAAELPEQFRNLLVAKGVSLDTALVPLKQGGNNQVFRLKGGKGDYALKRYFQHPGDARDRFNTERVFYTLLWNNGVRQIPEPCAWDAEFRVGLFSFVEGARLQAEEVNSRFVEQALEFVQKINALRSSEAAKAVPTASEAYFSIPEQVESVDKRVQTLLQIDGKSSVDQMALAFAKDELLPVWQKVKEKILQRVNQSPALAQPLEISQRCLSPSDFGYHNALLNSGRLQFMDFEYAGWDDPAKMVCDFFCQPQISVSLEFWDQFNQSVAASLGMGDKLAQRTRLLFPMFQMKWCCIILNHFIKIGRARREFAGSAASDEAALAQLEKARCLLRSIEI